ncbi:hypothetical protein Bca101_068012 [Brassica carinata]
MEALELSLRDINGGRDINEIISEVDTQNAPLRLLGGISNFLHFTHGMLTTFYRK